MYDPKKLNQLTNLNAGTTYIAFQDPASVDGLEVWFEWSRNLVQWDVFPIEQVEVFVNLAGDLVHSIDTSTIPKPHFIRLRLSAL